MINPLRHFHKNLMGMEICILREKKLNTFTGENGEENNGDY